MAQVEQNGTRFKNPAHLAKFQQALRTAGLSGSAAGAHTAVCRDFGRGGARRVKSRPG